MLWRLALGRSRRFDLALVWAFFCARPAFVVRPSRAVCQVVARVSLAGSGPDEFLGCLRGRPCVNADSAALGLVGRCVGGFVRIHFARSFVFGHAFRSVRL